MKKILLLDIENLPKTETELLQYLAQYQYVYLVYAKTPMGFSLDGVVRLAPAISAGKLKVLKMPKIGKDAADFGLCFIAGQLSTQYKSSEVCFEIMSNDFSMEYVADLLKIAKFQAKVISAKPLVNPNIAQQIKAEIDIQKLIFQYCSNLVRSNFSKPAKVETLINSLKANLKVEEKYAQLLVDELIRIKIIKNQSGKLQYQTAAIEKFYKQHLATVETVETVETQDEVTERKLSHLRLRLMPYLNVFAERRPKFIASFEALLERCVPKEEVRESLDLLIKHQLIQLNKREIIYSPQLLGN
ncbi:PIN domain-containing protein [Acinetobacter sp. YH12043]|uniref:PIN domain-containing protein n=1 Tax=Acinetobacter sp. YH12043 TaxID=2601050 RepID=UPI0015D21A6A|nr:PIN domain-containing protein [Acinetobacter sp. YH12043]